MNKVPATGFDYRDFAPEDRLQALQETTSSVYAVSALGDEREFWMEVAGYQINDLIFNDLKCSPATFERHEDHLRGEDQDFVVLQAQVSGEELLAMQHGIIRLLPGYLYLRDWAFPFRSLADTIHINSIVIPRRRLSGCAVFSAHNPILSWSRSEPEGRMLWQLWSLLLTEFEHIERGVAESLCRSFLGFLDGLINVDGHRGEADQPSLRAMELYLQQQLRGDVSVETLCERFHVSRASAFRLFKPHGGIKHYVNRLRLERSFTELSSAHPGHISVGYVASGWGYTDPADFRRRFRRQFGVSPSQVLGSTYNPPVDSKDARTRNVAGSELYRTYKDWLRSASNPIGF